MWVSGEPHGGEQEVHRLFLGLGSPFLPMWCVVSRCEEQREPTVNNKVAFVPYFLDTLDEVPMRAECFPPQEQGIPYPSGAGCPPTPFFFPLLPPSSSSSLLSSPNFLPHPLLSFHFPSSFLLPPSLPHFAFLPPSILLFFFPASWHSQRSVCPVIKISLLSLL